MKRDSMVWYESFSKAISVLPKENQINAYTFIINYGMYGSLPDETIDPIANAIFLMAKPQIDANNKRYLNGSKWGRPKQEWETVEKIQTKKNQNVTYSEDFEAFREAYPKKKRKQQARHAWDAAIKNCNDPKKIIQKAGDYATELKLKRVEEKFIKWASWWLEEWRFDDDYFTGNSNEKPDLDVLY